jgi:hypothetical protein
MVLIIPPQLLYESRFTQKIFKNLWNKVKTL